MPNNLVDDLLAAARSMEYSGEDEWPKELFALSPEDLVEILHGVAREIRLANLVQAKGREILGQLLGLDGRITDGNTFYKYKQPYQRKVTSDKDLVHWLGADWWRCFNMGDVKITAVRALAETRAREEGSQDVDRDIEKLERRMFDWRKHPTQGPKVTATPMDRVKEKYVQRMQPGKVYRTAKPEEEDENESGES